MATQEKLQYFYDTAVSSVQSYSEAELSKLKESLDEQFEEYKKQAEADMKLKTRLDSDNAKRVLLKELSAELLNLRKTEAEKQYRLRKELFAEVVKKLSDFRKTGDYVSLLCEYIVEAVSFAGSDDVILYMDPEDASLKEELEGTTKTNLVISDFAFGGGLQAAIPARNILIDNSFRSRLQDVKKTYKITAQEA